MASHAITGENRSVDRGARRFADFAQQPGLDVEAASWSRSEVT